MFIICKIEGDVFRSSPTPVVHETYQEADAEAERLSSLHIGIEFVVFEARVGKISFPGKVTNKSYNR